MPTVSILMPTFKQAGFIRRAIESIYNQSFTDWELWIIDDASPDRTQQEIEPYLGNPQIHSIRFETNQGMGAALNAGLDQANGSFIAYLPSDDVYYAEHLASLLECLNENPQAVAAFSGVRHHYNRTAPGQIDDFPLQLVQVVHRKTADRWMERGELVTDDLERMFWSKLRPKGEFLGTGMVTCEWVAHPYQRHKILREPEGGINLYRQYTGVKQPLRFHTTVGNLMDEVKRYRSFRERPDTPMADGGLKILLVGELAYNPERVLALEELGHKLYGLWMPEPYWYNYVGPLPFGHVEDLPHQNWQEAIRQVQPDVIYALLNWQAVPFAHHVLMENPGIPFVWHFKEGPFICMEKGTWSKLVELHRLSDGQIYTSPEMRDWTETAIPGAVSEGLSYILDGDLPKKDWFQAERQPLISEQDGEIHTVVPGRPIGLHPHNVADLAANRIHLHFYGDFTHGQWRGWIEKTQSLAAGYIHLHSHVDQENWVTEFSRYDAGWLHFFQSENAGDIRRSNWDDLNYPARIATLVLAGLPVLQRDNRGSIVATQTLAQEQGLGLFFTEMDQLAEMLSDRFQMGKLRENVWNRRKQFTFDEYAGKLVDFFREVIQKRKQNGHKDLSSILANTSPVHGDERPKQGI